MNRPLLIIITGTPCTGKTTLSRVLDEEFDVALISKDGIKELLYDSLGWEGAGQSRRLGEATFHTLFYFIESQIRKGNSLLVECPFIPRYHTERFTELKNNYEFDVFQILCRTDIDVLYQRSVERSRSPGRHPGHGLSPPSYDSIKRTLADNKYGAMDIGGTVYEYDTTDLGKIDIQTLIERIKEALNGM